MSLSRALTGALLASLATFCVGTFAWRAPQAAPLPPALDVGALQNISDADAEKLASVEAVKARLPKLDYQRARFDPIHFKPVIDHASNEACLVCHREISTDAPREKSPAGVKASDTLAWYQTLDTYAGDQKTFHWRHLQSPYAKQVMSLSCNFCHQGNDPRERSPHVTATDSKGAIVTGWPSGAPPFTLRKTVNPSETCLRCHGKYPAENMGLSGSWAELREGMESPDAPNGCLTCHNDIRTNRHQVSYLKPEAIEQAAKGSSDVCFGCHGGRQWYRISFPYPRHPWTGMPDETPDWAQNRPKTSDPRFALPQH